MRFARVPALLILIATAALFAQEETAPTQPSITLPPELQRVLTDYEKAWQAHDAEGLAGLFVEDGFVLPSRSPIVRGRSEILKHYKGSGGPLSLRAIAYATSGTAGFIIGAFTKRAGSPDLGKFTLTLRKEESGRWAIVSDMDNPNALPTPVR
jgi:ketosteroid isomerase-like protein